MIINSFRTGLCAGALGALMLAGCGGGGAKGVPGSVSLADPSGDDNGPGNYVYPTDKVYKPGSFDLRKFEVIPRGDKTEFRITVGARIEDPWASKDWGGNGFSVQMAFIHIDTDHKAGSGETLGMPGTNVRFADDQAWDRVVIISPQGPGRVNSEVDAKANKVKSKVVVPAITRANGRTLVAIVNTADLGGAPAATWGYNVLMQSNEGFPAKTDLLTRKVNEFEGQHRFGGGSDYDNDPHVIDMLAGVGKGGDDEAGAQHKALSAFNKEATEDVKPEDLATVPMIYGQ